MSLQPRQSVILILLPSRHNVCHDVFPGKCYYCFSGSAETQLWPVAKEARSFKTVSVLLPSAERKAIGAVTDFQHHAFFSPEFSVLPRKINENLRADFPSDANTREIRALRNILYIKNLHLRVIFSSHEMHRFSTWYSPFHCLICTILHHETDKTGGWYGHYRNAGRTIWDFQTGHTIRRFGRKWDS